MRIGKQDAPFTAICTSDATSITVRGRDLVDELMGQIDFTSYFWLLVTGQMPSEQQTWFTNAVLVALAEHGLVPSVVAARMTYAAAPEALQGAVAAGPAVFAPGIVRALFDPGRAVRALGLLGSIEALAPALAPILGAWLLALGGWRLPFAAIAAIALALAAAIGAAGALPQVARRPRGGYARLIAHPVFLRYALSQAFVLGGLLTFVFGMPAVFVHAFGGALSQFIVMQVCGIAGFMLLANISGRLLPRFGPERLISIGTAVACAGALGIFLYALAGGRNAVLITALFVPVNAGLGLRGPSGFYRAVLAARNDDARGAALVILGILGAAAIGTTLAAPFVGGDLVHLAAIALGFHVLAMLSLTLLPKLK